MVKVASPTRSVLSGAFADDSSIGPNDSASNAGRSEPHVEPPPHAAYPARSRTVAPSRNAASSSLAGHSMTSTHFNCLDCKQLLPMGMMSMSKKDRCAKDVASYKSLCDKWTRVRQLRTWWAALDAENKVERFRKHQRNIVHLPEICRGYRN